MLPPDLFYYNLGEFFRDMEELPTEDFFEQMGRMFGSFYKGALEQAGNESIALELTFQFMSTYQLEPSDEDGDEGE